MCIVIGKYFDDIGWVGVKNRDRNYIPEISFKKKIVNGVEVLYFWDNITQYCEGLNSFGMGILSASLMVLDDEKEITTRSKTPSKDGKKIKKALGHDDIELVVNSLVTQKLTGNTLIFNKNRMFLLEGAWEKGGYKKEEFKYQVNEIPKNKTIVRTNHGVWIPEAGYQYVKGDKSQIFSRVSSECRRIFATIAAERAKSPEEIIDNLTINYANDGQLNALRTTTEKKKMRTTSQILIIPREQTMFVRPVQSNIVFNFWELNNPGQSTWVEILSNRILYKNLGNNNNNDDLPFISKLSHDITTKGVTK